MSKKSPKSLSAIRRSLEINRNSQKKLRDEERELVQAEQYAESIEAGKLLKVHGVSVEQMAEILKKAKQERGIIPPELEKSEENKEDSNEEAKIQADSSNA